MSLLDSDLVKGAKNKLGFGPTVASPEYLGADFDDGFEITEIINGKEQEPIVLKGNQLPTDTFDFGGKQHLVKEFYPGNSQPVVQIMGAREENTKIKGVWKEKRLKEDVVGATEALQVAFDTIRRRGNLLKLRLGEWQRYGYLETALFKMKSLTHVEWELDFNVIGYDKPTDDFFTDSNAIPLDLNREAMAAGAEFSSLTPPATFPEGMGQTILSQIASVTTAIGLVTNYVSTLSDPNGFDKALGLIGNARSSIARFKRNISTLSLYVTKTGGALTALDEINKAINAKFTYSVLHRTSLPLPKTSASASKLASFSKSAEEQARALSIARTPSIEQILARMEKQFRALRLTIPKFRHLVKTGDTLQKISLRYYGDANSWEKIFKHNKLQSTNLAIGRILEIPSL